MRCLPSWPQMIPIWLRSIFSELVYPAVTNAWKSDVHFLIYTFFKSVILPVAHNQVYPKELCSALRAPLVKINWRTTPKICLRTGFNLFVLYTSLAARPLFCVHTDIVTVAISVYVASFHWSLDRKTRHAFIPIVDSHLRHFNHEIHCRWRTFSCIEWSSAAPCRWLLKL